MATLSRQRPCQKLPIKIAYVLPPMIAIANEKTFVLAACIVPSLHGLPALGCSARRCGGSLVWSLAGLSSFMGPPGGPSRFGRVTGAIPT